VCWYTQMFGEVAVARSAGSKHCNQICEKKSPGENGGKLMESLRCLDWSFSQLIFGPLDPLP